MSVRPAILFATAWLAVGCDPSGIGRSTEQATEIDPASFCTAQTAGTEACELEAAVAEHFETLKDDPDALAAFLSEMPKGGDLHSHLSGAVQTERLIEWAIEDGLCVRPSDQKVQRCSSGGAPVADVPAETLLSAWSMEGFEGSVEEGHDHFFATFGRFGLVTREHTADMLAAVRSHAAAHQEQYLELMLPMGTSRAGGIAQSVVSAETWDPESLAGAIELLLADDAFQANVVDSAAALAAQLAESEAILGCGTDAADPGCGVEVRYQVQVWRASSRESVLGQALYAFELAAREPMVVGLNLAAAEDHWQALATYDEAMTSLAVLRALYPGGAHVALHAGELVPELLDEGDQEHLTFHIREAVLTGAAERIGHGIDILHEESDELSSEELRATMRERGVAVEICLSSNRFILGVQGPEHPIATYLDSGVPTVIATDDEGVSRSSLTDELLTAVSEHDLDYRQTKALARRSLMHSFLPGESLLTAADGDLPAVHEACDSAEACQAFASASERGRVQLRLEASLAQFEARIASGLP